MGCRVRVGLGLGYGWLGLGLETAAAGLVDELDHTNGLPGVVH